ncbi:hypothetical protein IBX38_08245 [Candidatus Bathyarchaeota archaeon]|nr:hypothetical protein [Candidatus Bathyarchaeota archaeon]
MDGAEPIERLMDYAERYAEFVRKLSIETLLEITTGSKEHISNQLKEYNATRFYNRRAEQIKNCLENEEIVKDGKIVLLEDLKNSGIVNEDKLEMFRLKKCHFSK